MRSFLPPLATDPTSGVISDIWIAGVNIAPTRGVIANIENCKNELRGVNSVPAGGVTCTVVLGKNFI